MASEHDTTGRLTSRPKGCDARSQLWQLTASGVGIVIGAGIYVLVGEAAREAGAALWLSFAIAAVLAGLTALTYCELAGMFPSAGVEYEWTSRAFNPFVGYLAGWMMAVTYIVAAAAVSLGIRALPPALRLD